MLDEHQHTASINITVQMAEGACKKMDVIPFFPNRPCINYTSDKCLCWFQSLARSSTVWLVTTDASPWLPIGHSSGVFKR